mmetsp:Transcript_75282/g.104577  ORF Transcript_75282/g.104577 Transcript_75282/m.104577 type:complete len:261 (-) Transcript_75282:86-868(-)
MTKEIFVMLKWFVFASEHVESGGSQSCGFTCVVNPSSNGELNICCSVRATALKLLVDLGHNHVHRNPELEALCHQGALFSETRLWQDDEHNVKIAKTNLLYISQSPARGLSPRAIPQTDSPTATWNLPIKGSGQAGPYVIADDCSALLTCLDVAQEVDQRRLACSRAAHHSQVDDRKVKPGRRRILRVNRRVSRDLQVDCLAHSHWGMLRHGVTPGRPPTESNRCQPNAKRQHCTCEGDSCSSCRCHSLAVFESTPQTSK